MEYIQRVSHGEQESNEEHHWSEPAPHAILWVSLNSCVVSCVASQQPGARSPPETIVHEHSWNVVAEESVAPQRAGPVGNSYVYAQRIEQEHTQSEHNPHQLMGRQSSPPRLCDVELQDESIVDSLLLPPFHAQAEAESVQQQQKNPSVRWPIDEKNRKLSYSLQMRCTHKHNQQQRGDAQARVHPTEERIPVAVGGDFCHVRRVTKHCQRIPLVVAGGVVGGVGVVGVKLSLLGVDVHKLRRAKSDCAHF